ncbi:16S rRNA (cytidine(1402)-2'-O)-methyltransferase [Actinorhabdospora filicis]|uniref:16S rRNA (cytidine(1402)-2'-O)-methyltransferase n=1 Tax=Actinorhabdospora filicis TaxID=1785913 RepID=UPI002552DA5F|nr:16S rRNA (cytidine(1402)-2'-O)-methyltransferase [Actinorhabdospora filicis]
MTDAAPGRLILLGAPLGNPADASPRIAEVIRSADVVAAEDTRRLHRLARELGVSPEGKVVSYFEGNESERESGLVDALNAGYTVAVITDGGMPSVSDPGFRLVRAAVDAGIPVTSVPGPSAVTTALAVSGLASDRFCFEGFPPRKQGARRAAFHDLAAERRTMVFFESPHRVEATLADLREVFGADRQAALCRELTKTFEEVRRGTLAQLCEGVAADAPRGEITLVIAGAEPAAPAEASDADLAEAVAELEETGTQRKAAMAEVAARHGLRRRDVYEALLRVKEGDDG